LHNVNTTDNNIYSLEGTMSHASMTEHGVFQPVTTHTPKWSHLQILKFNSQAT